MAIKKYRATVTSLEDPEKRGRFKVSCPDLLGDGQPLPGFVEPELQHGWFNVPYINQQVIIEVDINDDQEHEVGIHSFVMNPIFIWRGEVAFTSDDYKDKYVVDSKFKENYTHKRGFITKKGLCIIFNDSDDNEAVEIQWTNKKKETASISIDKSGSVVLEDAKNNVISINAKENKIQAIHNTGPSVELSAGKINLTAPEITSTGAIKNTVTGAGATEISGSTVAIAPVVSLTISAGANVVIDAPVVQLTQGAIRAIIKSPEFLTFFDTHIHTPPILPGAFTGPPVTLATPLIATLVEPKVLI